MSNAQSFGVIFDLDGVLVDSVGPTWRAYNEVLVKYHVEILDSDLANYIGKPTNDQIVQMNRQFGTHIDAATFKQESDGVKSRLLEGLLAMPGAVSLVKELRRSGVPTCVGTSTESEDVERRLASAGLSKLLPMRVTNEDVQRHKPDPAVYLACAAKLGLAPSRCVVVEDAPSGVEAAKRAGAKCVGVTSSYANATQLAAADLVVGSLAQLDVSQLRNLVFMSN